MIYEYSSLQERVITMNELGKKIRDIRKAKKITLVELAKITGVAQASLSRIETGIMTGTVESHRKISEALGISLAELYEDLDSRTREVSHTKPNEENITVLNSDVSLEVLTTNTSVKKIVPVLYALKPGGKTRTEKLERGVERFYWVLDGEISITIDDGQYYLSAKNSVYFDASLPHFFQNTGQKVANVFCATSPPRI